MKLVQDYSTLSKRKQLAVGLVNVGISIIIILAIDRSMGMATVVSLRNIVITLIVGCLLMLVYGQVRLWHERRQTRLEGHKS